MSALTLRIIASITMLLDHIGYFTGCIWLRCIGRLAFPIYVYLMVNGFRYTKNRPKYALRLGIFAVISQVPYVLFENYPRLTLRHLPDVLTDPAFLLSRMNVLVTLLLGLLVIWSGEELRKHKATRYLYLLPGFLVFCLYYFGYISSDYGAKGILLALSFWLFDGKKLAMLLGTLLSFLHPQLISMAYDLLHGSMHIQPLSQWQCLQLLAVLALPLIWLYNHKPGRMPHNRAARKLVQYGFYAFYPLHIFVLWAIFRAMYF